ncbi:MAG: histidine phosphatase family protein [Trueperaceae bacterium]|nr:histidine phosphatase family protein [Trueperaceae bacterium]
MTAPATGEVWLLRHGETPWSLDGRHTGRTDVRLTPRGERQATALGQRIAGRSFAAVWTSPLARAFDTCAIAGFGDVAEVLPDLQEWDYGDYEGRTTADIRQERPGWSIWEDGAPGGERPEDVAGRAERAIARVGAAGGDVALFAHGHLLRVLAARWLGWPASAGGALALDTASVCVLAVDRGRPVVRHWNEVCHLDGER